MRNKRWRRWGLAVALPLALALNVFVLSAIASMNRTASERGPDLAASIEMLNIEPPEILETEEVEEETPPEEPEPLDLDLDLAPPEMTMSADLDDPLLDLCVRDFQVCFERQVFLAAFNRQSVSTGLQVGSESAC